MSRRPERVAPPLGQNSPCFSVEDAAAHWGVDRATIYRWVRSERLAHTVSPAGGVRFTFSQMTQPIGGAGLGGGNAQAST